MMMEDRTGYIRVTNHDSRKIVGKYDGREYVFQKDAPLDVPEIVAMHIFDFGKDDKTTALNRLGWIKTSEDFDEALERLNKISFEDPPEMIEAPSPKKGKAHKRIGTAGPPVDADGTEGGEFKSPPNGPKIGESGEDDDDF